MNFHDSVLFASVLLLDRYCAGVQEPVQVDTLLLTVTAIVSVALKVSGADEFTKPPKLTGVLTHLAQYQFQPRQIYAAELDVLQALDFQVSVPTSQDFFETLMMPFLAPGPENASPVWCIAKFLLQLSLLDVPLQYRYSHEILAAGAIYMALWCTKASSSKVLALMSVVESCQHKEITSLFDDVFDDNEGCCGGSSPHALAF